MVDVLAAAVHAAFPDQEVAAIEPRDARPGNRTARVTFADGREVYVKTVADGHIERLARDAAATRYVGAHTDLAVAEVVAADPDGDPPYLATTPVGGAPLADDWRDTDTGARADLLRDVGDTIARLHELQCEHAGRVVGGDADHLELDGGSWSETLRATVDERVDTLFADRFTDLPPRLDDVLADAAPLLDGALATLLHGDLNRSNCRIRPAGLLDWERALVGDPSFDIVDAEAHLVEQSETDEATRKRLRAALHDGYRAWAGSLPLEFRQRRPVYRAFGFLLTPQTFDQWAPEADEPTDELAAWVREEFDSRLAAARDAAGGSA